MTSSFIGADLGRGVSKRALWGTSCSCCVAAVFMTLYFRAWRMSVAAIALLRDLLISAGVYAAIGWEVTPSTIIGFLTILGFSLYDTMVVFDKVRENTADMLTADAQHLRGAGQPRGQPDAGAVDQHLGRGAAAGRAHPLRGYSCWVPARCTPLPVALRRHRVGTASSLFLATPLDVALREREPEITAHTQDGRSTRAGRAPRAVARSPAAAARLRAASGALRAGRPPGRAAQPKRARGR